jgi:hypothetical protein
MYQPRLGWPSAYLSQLGDLNVQSINKYADGQPKRGWYMAQQEALAVVNPHAVVRGQKS